MNEEDIQAQISELPFPDCVRLRRGMYISDRNQMITEIIDNSVDEHYAGYCDTIAIALIGDEVIIEDNGRGIPCSPCPDDPSITQVEKAFTILHAGGKFGKKNGYKKKTSGMHGVGGSCVQALSEYMNVQITYDGKVYETDFAKGLITNNTFIVGKSENPNEHGTSVKFKFDEEIWKDSDPLNLKALKKRIKQIAFLNPGLTMYFVVKKDNIDIEETYYYENGLKSYIEELTKNKNRLTDIINITTSKDDIDVSMSFAYTDSYNCDDFSFCNNMCTYEGGDHVTGFYAGLNNAFKKYMEKFNINFDYKPEDSKEGLVAVIAVRVADPVFVGQAKTKLKESLVRSIVKDIAEETVSDYLDKNPKIAKVIMNKIELASKARNAVKKAREAARKTKSLVEGGVPEKLADCTSKNPEECEIYIVEGDSAGGSAKQGRDRKFQAILPVFGKVANVEKKRFLEVIKNEKFNMLVKSAKFGIGDEFDITKSRYHKFILMSDADVDGSHIQCLWVTYFFRYLRPIIEAGWLYIACPPLFKIQKGKNTIRYAYSDKERDEIVAELGKGCNIQRYKGLGEMDAEQLWETTLNPENRRLYQVTIEDAEEAEQAISLCMSEDCSARREWIMENADMAIVE